MEDTDDRDALVELAVVLVKHSTTTGQLAPVLPPDSREQIANTLVRCMVDTEVRTVFTSAVQSALVARDLFPLWVKRPAMPEQLIQERGFEALTDDQLAWLAIDPTRVAVVHYGLACGSTGPDGMVFTPGRWYSDAIHEHVAHLPRLAPDTPPPNSNNTPPSAEPLAVPSSVVTEQTRAAQRDSPRRRWRAVTIAALVLLGALGTAGGTYAGVHYIQKRNRSTEVLSQVASAREHIKGLKREEAIRVFEQADNLGGSPVSNEARGALNSLKAEIELLKSLSDLYVKSYREWLDHAGIKKVSDKYLEFFTEAGILDGGRDVTQQAAAIRARPEVASYLIAGIDHWLNVLNLLPPLPPNQNPAEQAERQQLDSLTKELKQIALAADDGDPSKKLRQFVADNKLDEVLTFFEKNKSNGLLPETVGMLTDFLISKGRADTAYLLAQNAWWRYPSNATLNGILFGLSTTPADRLLFAGLQTAADPENGVFWFNLAKAHAANNNRAASEFARDKANTLNPALRDKP